MWLRKMSWKYNILYLKKKEDMVMLYKIVINSAVAAVN